MLPIRRLALLALGVFLGLTPAFAQKKSAERQLQVDWLGHECFLFTSSLGLKILVNPFSPGTVARELPGKLSPDILLITTEDPAFNNDGAVDNAPVVFRGAIAAGLLNASGLRIRGVQTSGDMAAGSDLVFAWTMDSVRICYAGNPRRTLTSEEAMLIGKVDVLFLPVGLSNGLTDAELHKFINQLQPLVIVPMGSPKAVESWASTSPRPYRLSGNAVYLSQGRLPREPIVLVFNSP